jgi:hypothetical protein
MAARGEGLPANTYVAAPAPATDGEGKKAAGGGTSLEPDPSQKWCDGIAIENGQLIFKGIEKNGRRWNASVDISKFFELYLLINGATTDDIKWYALRIEDKNIAYIVIETESNSVLLKSFSDLGDANESWGKVIFAKDGTKIFVGESAIYIAKDGTIVATTPTTILIIQKGENGRVKNWTYEEIAGGPVPPLVSPVLDEENGWVRIRDPTIKDEKGNKYKILLDTDSMRAAIVEIEATPILSKL